MKRWLGLRTILALLAGVAAGLLVALLPPMPSYTARLPDEDVLEGGIPFTLYAIASDARYLVTNHRLQGAENANGTIHVWDRARGLHKSVIQLPTPAGYNSFRILFSPDETQLAIVIRFSREAQHTVHLYDLASVKLVKQWEAKFDHLVYSPDGKLLVVADRVVRDLKTDEELRRLPDAIEEFIPFPSPGEYRDDFAVYRHERRVRLYSLITGKTDATHDLIGESMHIDHLSRDGQVIGAKGWAPGTGLWTMGDFRVLIDASGKVHHDQDKIWWARGRVLSPDGRHYAQSGPASRPAWLAKWWPVNSEVQTVRLSHLTTGKELGTFAHVVDASFSPQGNQLAIIRDDAAIDVYEFPFKTPWGLIAGAVLLCAGGSWSVGWLWGRWRNRAVAPPNTKTAADARR